MPTYSFLPFLQNVPIGTRILTGTLIIFSLLHQVFSHIGPYDQSSSVSNIVRGALGDDSVGQKGAAYDAVGDESNDGGGVGLQIPPYLVVVTGKALWFPWTFLTAGWVETNIIQVSWRVLNAVPRIDCPHLLSSSVHHLCRRSSHGSKVPRARLGASRTHSVQRNRDRRIKHHSLWS